MSEEKIISPFETGVLAAMMLVGKAVALNPHVDIEKLKADAKALMESMPAEPKWKGSSGANNGIYQAALKNLIAGTEKVQR